MTYEDFVTGPQAYSIHGRKEEMREHAGVFAVLRRRHDLHPEVAAEERLHLARAVVGGVHVAGGDAADEGRGGGGARHVRTAGCRSR